MAGNHGKRDRKCFSGIENANRNFGDVPSVCRTLNGQMEKSDLLSDYMYGHVCSDISDDIFALDAVIFEKPK